MGGREAIVEMVAGMYEGGENGEIEDEEGRA